MAALDLGRARRVVLCAVGAVTVMGASGAAAEAFPEVEAPMAEKRPVSIEQHGITRVDNYGWLRDDNWQEVLRDPSVLRDDVRAHLEAENAYYEAMTADLEGLRETLFTEMRGRIQEDASSVPSPDGPWAYYSRFREGGDYPIFAREPRDGGDEQILFDGDAEAGDSDFFSIGGLNTSPDHRLMAYGVDRLGSEYYTVRIRNLETGEEFADSIENTSGGVIWAADSKSFYYTERDENQRPKRIKHHVLGTDVADDRVVYEEPSDTLFLSAGKSQSGEYVFISSGNGETSETRFVPASDLTAEPVLIAPRVDGQLYNVEHRGERFYIRTNADGAVDFKIVSAPIANPGRENWEDWLAYQPGVMVVGFTTYADHLVRLVRRDANTEIVIADYDRNEHTISFESPAYSLGLSSGREFETSLVRFTYEDFAQPEQTFDYDMVSRERTLRKTQEVPSGHNPDLYVVERITATAADGAQVPVSIIRLKTTPLDGSAPLLLYGYGSYGATIPAGFSTTNLSLVDRGMVYALAHIRGGAAKGRQWYLDGKLEKKMNTFTDFNSAAQALIEAGYTSQGRIVTFGGSAGGLLVGASVNLQPELFAGVIGAVPFVDVINTISDADLPLTPPEWVEWGNPITSAEEYGWIAEYSPYDNIKPGVAYPPIFATGGLTDYRVTYWEPAKWIARLREEAGGGPFVMRMIMDAGHGGSAARFESLRERAHLFAFALHVVGSAEVEPADHAVTVDAQ